MATPIATGTDTSTPAVAGLKAFDTSEHVFPTSLGPVAVTKNTDLKTNDISLTIPKGTPVAKVNEATPTLASKFGVDPSVITNTLKTATDSSTSATAPKAPAKKTSISDGGPMKFPVNASGQKLIGNLPSNQAVDDQGNPINIGSGIVLPDPVTIKVPFVDKGVTVQNTLPNALAKGVVEFPERLVNDISDTIATLQGKTPNAGNGGRFSVGSYIQDANNFNDQLTNNGMTDTQAKWISTLYGVSSGLFDVTALAGALDTGVKALSTLAAVPDESVQAAMTVLGNPESIGDAETSWKNIQKISHPDLPTGNADVSKQANNAISILRNVNETQGLDGDFSSLLGKGGVAQKIGQAASAVNEGVEGVRKALASGPTLEDLPDIVRDSIADTPNKKGGFIKNPLVDDGEDDETDESTPAVDTRTPQEKDSGLPAKTEQPKQSVIGAFNDQDVKPAIKNAKSTVRGVKNALSPQYASPEATQTADYIRKAKASIQNDADIEFARNKTTSDLFAKNSDKENIANISEYERTGKFSNAPEGYSDMFKKSMDASRQIMTDVYGEDKVGLVENYVRRQFKFGSTADEAKGTAYLTNNINSLSASKSPLKGRTLDMPLEDALEDMKARGIKVKPATTNPEILRQWSVQNAKQALAYADVWNQLKDGGHITFVQSGSPIPDNMVKLNDRAAQVFYPTDKGVVQSGSYYADENVARVLNNTVSQGLSNVPGYKAIRQGENILNQFSLGISAFHLTATSINAGISDLALGASKIMSGDIGEGIATMTRGVIPGVSFANDTYKGTKFLTDLKNNSPEAYEILKTRVNPAGGRLKLDNRYQIKAYENMISAFKNGNPVGGIFRVPGAVIEKVAAPLMEKAIPRVKISAFLSLADKNIAKLGLNASKEEIARVAAEAWDSIENRFGQLTYDNLFWNKTAKDLAMTVTRSLGWNLGTVRELGGGITDIATKTFKGKGLTDRTLYTMMLPLYVGALGAAYQYLHTGKKPSSLKDYFYPQNGLTNSNGDPVRVSLPSYMKDVYSWSTNPASTVINKASPLLSFVSGLAQNQDYYGDMIRNPNDPISQQLEQVGSYAAQQFIPFSLETEQKENSEGATAEEKAESFLGVNQAPAAIIESPKEKAIETAYQAQNGTTSGLTPEMQQIDTLKSQARTEFQKNGASPAFTALLDQLITLGGVTPGKGVKAFEREADETPSARLEQGLKKTTKNKINQQFQ